MSKPRCVLCGEEFKAVPAMSSLRQRYRVVHHCRIDLFNIRLRDDGSYPTKAAALAAIPERFVKEER